MAAPKRTPDQIARDQAIIAELYLRGWQQARIADHLSAENGIQYSIEMIRRDLRMVREKWRNSALSNFNEIKQEQMAKLDLMEAKTWDQWMRSCEDYHKHTSGLGPQGPIDKTETGGQTGDPRYMTVLLSIIERRCKILGIDAPQKIAPTNPDGDKPYEAPTSSEVKARIQELLEKLNFNHAGSN